MGVRFVLVCICCLVFPSVESASLDIYVDAQHSHESFLNIRQEYKDVKSIPGFVSLDPKNEYYHQDVVLRGSGPDQFLSKNGREYKLENPVKGNFSLSYKAYAGSPGRHGMQGNIGRRFVSVDGRVFILPIITQSIKTVRLHFTLPKGWSVHTHYKRTKNKHYLVEERHGPVFHQLKLAGLVLGKFEDRKKRIGKTIVHVVMPKTWQKSYRAQLANKSFALYEYFSRTFGLKLPDYYVGWTPYSTEGKRIYGASWAMGTTMEMEKESLRNWELLAHRIAHSINKYVPTGMEISKKEDSWFKEGWPSYMEIVSLQKAGITQDQSRWNHVFKRYMRYQHDRKSIDVPLVEEHYANTEQQEYLHYLKAPIVVKILQDYLVKHSGGGLQEFMAQAYQRHGSFTSSLDLRRELEAYAGISLERFWDVWIKGQGLIYPVWREYPRLTRKQQVKTIKIYDRVVTEDFVLYLMRHQCRWYSCVPQIIWNEKQMWDQFNLLQGKIRDLPDLLIKDYHQLPGAGRWLMYQNIRQRIKDPAWRAGPVGRFHGHKLAKYINRLVTLDNAYQRQLSVGVVKSIEFRQNSSVILVADNATPVKLYLNWKYGGFNSNIKIYINKKLLSDKDQKIPQHWTHSYQSFDLPQVSDAGILKAEIRRDGQLIGTRSILYMPK